LLLENGTLSLWCLPPNIVSQTTDQLILIGGVLFATNWTNQLSRGNLFVCIFFVFYGQLSSTWSCQSPGKDFDGFIEIEYKTFESMLESLPLHGGLWRNACYAKNVALQLATYQRLCLNGHFGHLLLLLVIYTR
jgi:hypothetical protein